MSLLLPPYRVGLASVDAGGTAVSIPGAILTDLNARELDMFVDAATGISVFIRAVPSTTALTIDAWPGGALADAEYRIEKTSPLRYAGGKAMADVQRLVDYLNTLNIIISVVGDEPDADAGEDGWFALKSNTAGWKLWHKEDGFWVEQGAPVGTETRGPWSAAETYLVNDEVFDLNSSGRMATWRSKTINTNKRPRDNPTDWQLSADSGARGATWTSGVAVPVGGTDEDFYFRTTTSDVYKRSAGVWSIIANIRGVDGGGLVIPYSFDGLSTSVADPGAGKLRLNNAIQNAATAIVVSTIDSRTLSFAAALDEAGSGTSEVKQLVRLYKASDQTKFVLFNVTAVNAGSGFRSLVGSVVASSGTTPFANNDALAIAFARVGDKGDKGDKGDTGTSYRERPYDPATTYVSNATYIDRVIYDGQTWTCTAASVNGVTPGTDASKWVLASRGVSPAVIDAATIARDQAQQSLAAVQAAQTTINATADAVAADAAAANSAADTATTAVSDIESTAATVEGLIESALAIAAQAADDGDADDETGSAATVDDGDADL